MKYLEVGLWSESRGWRSDAGLFHNRCTISQCDGFAGNRRHALAGYDDSEQIQWAGGGDCLTRGWPMSLATTSACGLSL
jgi:hypothetical protein